MFRLVAAREWRGRLEFKVKLIELLPLDLWVLGSWEKAVAHPDRLASGDLRGVWGQGIHNREKTGVFFKKMLDSETETSFLTPPPGCPSWVRYSEWGMKRDVLV